MACLVLLASPALAQSFNPDDGDGNVLTGPGYNPAPLWGPDHDYGYGFGMYGDNGGLAYDYVRPGYGYEPTPILREPMVESAPAGRVSGQRTEPSYPASGTVPRYQAVEAPARQTTTTETEPAYPTFGVPRRY